MARRPRAPVGSGRGLVGCHRFIPHAHRHEDVAGHVPRMVRAGRDLRVRSSRAKAERGMNRVVEGVDDVVRRARVVGISEEDVLRQRAGAHVGGHVAGAPGSAPSARARRTPSPPDRPGTRRRAGPSRRNRACPASPWCRPRRGSPPPGGSPAPAGVRAFPRRASAVGASRPRTARAESRLCWFHTGWVKVIASPQYASAKPGSACWASRNAAAASSYSKLWSSNTPRMKARWAGLAPELGKEMVPSLAAACPASGLARDSASTAVRLKPSTGRTERPGRRRLRARARATTRRMPPRQGMRSTIPHGADPRQVIMLRRAGLAPLRPCPAPQAVLGQSGCNWFPMAQPSRCPSPWLNACRDRGRPAVSRGSPETQASHHHGN